ncbi:MAG TPA: putative Ig domain-containing protein [Candidatus Acidoferrales bacterium]|nr:putative Ig domain-containing protein [Candidatus Acidoferrales bacterium]
MRQVTQGTACSKGASESVFDPVRPAAIALALLTLLLVMSLTGCGLTTNSGAKQVPASVAQLKIATPTLPAAQTRGSYQASLAASGGKAPYTWNVTSGVLPTGLALTSATGTISGIPSQAGAFSFSVQVRDSSSPLQTASASLTLNVSSATSSLKIVNTSLPAGQVGVAYQASNTASGGTSPYTWSITSGALPVGLALSASSGAISGKPSVSGSSSFMIRVSDAASNWAQQPLSIQIGATTPPSSTLKIITTSLLAGAVGQGYSTTIQATGGTPGYTWSVASGNFPPGLQFDSTSGAIGGVPTVAGQYTFVAQVSDSSTPAQTASQSISISISTASTTNVGLGSTIAGGLMALPPNRQLGTNVLPNGGLESGITGWYIPKCWAVDSTVAHSGTNSLRFTAGGTCTAAYAPPFTFQANTSYTIGAWVKASAGSNLRASMGVADDSDSSLPVAGIAPMVIGTTWTFVSLPDVDLLALHNGDQLRTRLVVSAPTGQTPTGQVWFDDVTSQPETPLPVSSFLLYPNFRGYLWQSGPQQIRLHVDVANPSGASVQIGLQLEGGATVNTVQQAAQATQEIDIDGSQLALGSYLIHTAVTDSNGQTVTYPDYRITKVSDTFKSSLVNYVDTDNFLVHNGQKEFVWGVYDRDSTLRCQICMYTTAAQYESNIAGFNGMGTLANYQDTQLNAMTNFAPWSAMSPGPPAVFDQLDPAMQALQARGVGYIQTVNNWISSNQYRPNWATSLTDPQLWQLAASMMTGKSGGLGYYTYDEPKLNLLPGVFAQYQTLRQGNSGSVTWGTLITADQIYRWRDTSDVVGADPYPVGIPVGIDEYAVGSPEVAATSPSYIAPTVRVSLWTEGAEQQVFNSRPVWTVLQLWRQWGQFPIYEQMKESAYKAIIGGANGIMWWGFVSAAGMEEEVDIRGNLAAYTDFKRISTEVQALQPYLIAPPQPQMLSSVSDPKIETLVKADSKQVVIFATSDSASSVSNVTFNLSSLVQSSATSVTAYSEGRTLAFSGNTFTDSFAPYEAHVYIITLP